MEMALRRLPPPNDPLEAARHELSRLKDAEDWDEPTGKTEVTVNLQPPTAPQPSQPDREDKVEQVLDVAKGMRSDWAKVALLLGLALIGAAVYLVLKLR
jgi:hypothetical protein